jgi:hypothetical protein
MAPSSIPRLGVGPESDADDTGHLIHVVTKSYVGLAEIAGALAVEPAQMILGLAQLDSPGKLHVANVFRP